MKARRFARHRPKELPEPQFWDLVIGGNLGTWDSAFPSDTERRAAWNKHRDRLIATCRKEGFTPHAQIRFELGGFRPEDTKGRVDPTKPGNNIGKAEERLRREGKIV